MNINGNDNDTNYRYKMPVFKVTIAGKGNGIYTIFSNINDISKSLNHPIEVIMKYIAAILGSNYIPDKNTITGSHKSDELKIIIMEYNKYLVICSACGVPETVPCLLDNKKNSKLNFKCSACNHTTEPNPINKRITKGIDIITKYLKFGGEWKINKGTCISQTKKSNEQLETDQTDNSDEDNPSKLIQITQNEEFNPFDFI